MSTKEQRTNQQNSRKQQANTPTKQRTKKQLPSKKSQMKNRHSMEWADQQTNSANKPGVQNSTKHCVLLISLVHVHGARVIGFRTVQTIVIQHYFHMVMGCDGKHFSWSWAFLFCFDMMGHKHNQWLLIGIITSNAWSLLVTEFHACPPPSTNDDSGSRRTPRHASLLEGIRDRWSWVQLLSQSLSLKSLPSTALKMLRTYQFNFEKMKLIVIYINSFYKCKKIHMKQKSLYIFKY